MTSERRGCGSLYEEMANQQWEEPTLLSIASVSRGIVEMASRSRMSREVHVRSLWGTGGEIPPVYPARPDVNGDATSGRTTRARVRMRSSGTDCLVVVMKRGNARGAKGTGHSRHDRVVNWQQEELRGRCGESVRSL